MKRRTHICGVIDDVINREFTEKFFCLSGSTLTGFRFFVVELDDIDEVFGRGCYDVIENDEADGVLW
jgi:hypothetical protein